MIYPNFLLDCTEVFSLISELFCEICDPEGFLVRADADELLMVPVTEALLFDHLNGRGDISAVLAWRDVNWLGYFGVVR